jgi:hypothetical protein
MARKQCIRMVSDSRIKHCGGNAFISLFSCVIQHARVAGPIGSKDNAPNYCVQLLSSFQKKGKTYLYLSFSNQLIVPPQNTVICWVLSTKFMEKTFLGCEIEAFIVVNMKISVFWDGTLCSLVEVYQHFGGILSLCWE